MMKFLPFLLGLIIASSAVTAQRINIQKKVENKVINRADKRADQGIDKGLDAVEDGIKDAAKGESNDSKNAGKTTTESENNTKSDSKAQNSDAESKTPATPADNASPTLAAYSKFDFIPGEKVIFYEDFIQDAVGDFPALWNTNTSGEVVTTNLFSGNWFKLLNEGNFTPLEPIDFGENFTLEFDLIPMPTASGKSCILSLTLYNDPLNKFTSLVPGDGGVHINLNTGNHSYKNYLNNNKTYNQNNSFVEINGTSEKAKLELAKKYHVSVWVQKRRLRVYLNETKLFDLPTAFPAGFKCNRFRYSLWDRPGEPLVSNIRIAVGAPDLRNKLLTEGRLVSYGIYFDSGSDVVKPESYGTIKSIADILSQNPDVRVKIIGHTDSDGNAAKNLELSKKRSAAVKNELVNNFGIDASRIETDGKGMTEPVGPNDSSANKALNRRVEFIKL